MHLPPGRNAERRLVILCETLDALESMRPGAEIVDLPYGWDEEFAMNLDSGYNRHKFLREYASTIRPRARDLSSCARPKATD